ncbi:MAG: hypothetical protein HY290_33575 [Planctomycetia bacterium]|nr:hypothetical protein [Planctomycetia bacterium]
MRVGLLLTNGVIQSFCICADSPINAVDLGRVVSNFCTAFKNCDFIGTQTQWRGEPRGTNTVEMDVRALICSDAIFIQARDRRKVTRRGKTTGPAIRAFEQRWLDGQPRIEINFAERLLVEWPLPAAPLVRDDVQLVVVDESLGARRNALDGILLDDFANSVQHSNITFTEMVSESGKYGYRLRSSKWEDASHSRVSCEFESAVYGITRVTCDKCDRQWLVSEIQIVKLPQHKVVATDGLTDKPGVAAHNSIRNRAYLVDSDFAQPNAQLDQLESTYRVAYRAPSDLGHSLPESVTRTDRRLSGNEASVLTITLTFKTFRSGTVTHRDVTESIRQLPDNCRVAMANKSQTGIVWTTNDGKIIKQVDHGALQLGRAVAVASTPSYRRILLAHLIAGAVVLLLLWHRLRTTG